MSAGATPFIVTPDLAYALASQWTRPWSADFEDLGLGSAYLPALNEGTGDLRIVGANNPAIEASNAGAENHSAPASLLHLWQA
jgi:hypothetical protein